MWNTFPFLLVSLALAVIASALAMIYLTHSNQDLHAEFHRQLNQQNRLLAEQRQLLLEKSTLMMQARVQDYAENKLQMLMPERQNVIIVRD